MICTDAFAGKFEIFAKVNVELLLLLLLLCLWATFCHGNTFHAAVLTRGIGVIDNIV